MTSVVPCPTPTNSPRSEDSFKGDVHGRVPSIIVVGDSGLLQHRSKTNRSWSWPRTSFHRRISRASQLVSEVTQPGSRHDASSRVTWMAEEWTHRWNVELLPVHALPRRRHLTTSSSVQRLRNATVNQAQSEYKHALANILRSLFVARTPSEEAHSPGRRSNV